MKVSWNWLSEYVDLSGVGGPQGLAELLTSRGLEVEEIQPQAAGLESVVTVQILERAKHPQADRLSVCKVTTGQGEPLDIVCGAQNMKAGDRVALATVGAQLPNDMKISQSKIRGVVSNGMLCSESELGFQDESEGILILPESTPLGRPLAEVLGKNDTILVLKLTANRGDCLSHYGLAREVAAAIGKKTKKPEYEALPASGSKISIHLEAGSAAPQFFGCEISGVKIGPSPEWLVKRLETVGSRSINNVVDATNFVMLELGHPMHAYDADRIEGAKVGVRVARSGEQLPLLDGKSVELDGSELVIFDSNRPIGLAGVMGGGNSEVKDGTTRLFLECAEFSPVLVRRAAQRHQRRTEAAQRFEKGIDPRGLFVAISRLASVILQVAGGRVVGTASAFSSERSPTTDLSRRISVPADYFNGFLGLDSERFGSERFKQILSGLDCVVTEGPEGPKGPKNQGSLWQVEVPSYRLDLNLKEDLAEEIARSVGYDQIPSTVPGLRSAPRSLAENASGARFFLMGRAKDALAATGLSETLSYPWASRSWFESLGVTPSVRVTNPLSEEDEWMSPSLLPLLIRTTLRNWNHHFGSERLSMRLFELRPTFAQSGEAGSALAARSEVETTAEERWKLGMVLSGPRLVEGLRSDLGEVDFYDVKGALENFFEAMGTRGVRYVAMPGQGSPDPSGVRSLFHPGQTAEIRVGNAVAGFAGMLHPARAAALKIAEPLWLVELDWDVIAGLSIEATGDKTYKPISEFPPMERDFALLVKGGTNADKITQIALKAGKPLAKVAKIFDVYRGSQVAEGMTSVAVRVIFFDEARSIQESETEAASAQILEAWKKELGAQLR